MNEKKIILEQKREEWKKLYGGKKIKLIEWFKFWFPVWNERVPGENRQYFRVVQNNGENGLKIKEYEAGIPLFGKPEPITFCIEPEESLKNIKEQSVFCANIVKEKLIIYL